MSTSRFVLLVACGSTIAAVACSDTDGASEASSGSAGMAATSGPATGSGGSAGTGTSGTAGNVSSTGGSASGGDAIGGNTAGGGSVDGGAGADSAKPSDGAAGDGSVAGPDLVPSSLELIFSGVQNTRSAAQTLTLRNPSATAVQIASVTLDPAAQGTPAFELSGPQAGSSVAPGMSASAPIIFRPTAVGVFSTRVLIKTAAPAGEKSVALFGLGAKGLEGENEPLLKPVIDTLGFAINVGGNGTLSTTTPLVGDEVQAFRFKASGTQPVELVPVARYSPAEPIPYGYYSGANEVPVGVIASDQFQTLYPATEAGAKLTFEAPASEFGLFTTSKTHKTYTDDTKNAGNPTKHAVRTYPLKNRQGILVPNAYLVCMEEAANGDYQDYVFKIANVVPVAR